MRTSAQDTALREIQLVAPQAARPCRHNQCAWYSNAFRYWESTDNCPITDDGVLGGYGRLTPQDVVGSTAFLHHLSAIRPELKLDSAADCGAGIGRVTKHFLLHNFRHVSLVEQSPRLLASAPQYIASSSTNSPPMSPEEVNSRVSLVNIGLQDFSPAPDSYDCIWIQWVVGHLPDNDYISFFR